jgi:hypothetical protein
MSRGSGTCSRALPPSPPRPTARSSRWGSRRADRRPATGTWWRRGRAPRRAPTRSRGSDAAAALLAGPDAVAWNAGIFLWRRAAILDALEATAPDILATIREGVAGGPAALESAYATVRATSIDYAVLEPASLGGRVAMVRADVGWSDLGSWAALRDALVARAGAAGEPGGAVGSGPRRDIGSEGTLVLGSGRLIVTLGLRDTIVVDTPDALLVCAADRSQEVRAIAEELARSREVDP